MASNQQGLEKIGVSIVAEGLAAYQKQMSDYVKKTQDATKATTDFQDKTSKTGAKGGGLLGFISNLVDGFKKTAQSAASGIPVIGNLIAGISAGALIAVGAVAILAAGIFLLGMRGAEFIGIQTAFNNTLIQFSDHLGTSAEFLTRLRTAAGDTISELELMRITNIALAGATGEVGQAFGEALPSLLEIARVQAAATGQSVDYLFQSLVTGIKRSSPLLIDNTGLVLKIGEANEAYAASIGKTVAELTAQEQQIALIQATLAAGNAAMLAAGGIQETAATKNARSMALIQNSLDNLAIAVEPILSGIQDVFNFFASGVEQATSVIGPILREMTLPFQETISSILGVFTEATTKITGIKELIVSSTSGIAGIISNAIAPVIGIFQSLFSGLMSLGNELSGAIAPIISQGMAIIGSAVSAFGELANFLQPFIERVIGVFVSLGTTLITVGGFIIQGVMAILGVVQSVLVGIGRFLAPVVGFILDTIVGLGEMLAGGIQFFVKGAAAIAGAIGNGLLAGANAFIFPTVIGIAQFIADFLSGFSPPKEGPLSTIDTGAANVMKAWTEGFIGAFKPQAIADVANQVDMQLANIGSLGIGQVEKRIRLLDRALRPFQEQLKIVKDQFDSLKTAADAGLSAIDRQLERLQPALLAGDEAAAAMTRQLNVQRLAIQQNLDAQHEQVDIATLQLAYAQSQQQRERTLLEIQKARLGVQNKQAKAVQKTVAASGAKAPVAPKTGGGASTTSPVTGATGVPIADAGKLEKSVGTNPFPGLDFTTEVGTEFMDFLGAGGELETFQQNSDALSGIIDQIGASNPVQGIIGAFDGFGEALQDNFVTPISEKVAEGVAWFTDPAIEGGLANFFTRLREEGVASVLGDLAPGFTEFLTGAILTPLGGLPVLQTIKDIFLPVNDWITGVSEDGGLPAMVNQIGVAFDYIPDLIWNALQSIGLLLWNTLAVPFIGAINAIILKINEFFGVINNSELVNFARTQLGIQIPEVSFELISTDAPAGLINPPPPPARKGGLFTGGAVRTHREEVMMSSEPFAIFSQQFVRAMSVLSNAILTSPMFTQSLQMPVGVSSNGTVNNQNLTINANMRGDSSPIDIATRIAMEGAMT